MTREMLVGMLVLGLAAGAHAADPKDKKQPAKAAKEKTVQKSGGVPSKIAKQLVAAVKKYVQENSDMDGGLFQMKDYDLNVDWNLKLVKVDENLISKVNEDQYRVPARFSHESDEDTPEAATLDVDFTVGQGEEGLDVDEAVIRQVDGKPRFTYGKDNKRIPVEIGDTKTKKQGAAYDDEEPMDEESAETEAPQDDWGKP